MAVLDHLAEAAAVILLLELLVVLLVFLGIAGGLAWGLRWVRGKVEWAFGKVNAVNGRATEYARRGLKGIATPFFVGARLASTLTGTLEALRSQIPRTPPRDPEVAARPVPPAQIAETVPMTLLDETRSAEPVDIP